MSWLSYLQPFHLDHLDRVEAQADLSLNLHPPAVLILNGHEGDGIVAAILPFRFDLLHVALLDTHCSSLSCCAFQSSLHFYITLSCYRCQPHSLILWKNFSPPSSSKRMSRAT